MTKRAITQAVVLAAGLGKRMRPLTNTVPKPLVKVGGRALIDYALAKLMEAGVKKVCVNLHYLGDQIRAHLENMREMEIVFSEEPNLLDTGGGVKQAKALLDDGPFYVINSDNIWTDGAEPLLLRLAENWDEGAMDVLMACQTLENAIGYDGLGDYFVEIDGTARRRAVHEPEAPHVFMGIQVLGANALKDTPDGAFSLRAVYDRAQEAGRLHALLHDADWFHVGSPKGITQTENRLSWIRP